MTLKKFLLGLALSASAFADHEEANHHHHDRIRYRCRVVAYNASGKALDHMYGPLSRSQSEAESEAESECRGYLYRKGVKNGSCVVGDCFSYEM